MSISNGIRMMDNIVSIAKPIISEVAPKIHNGMKGFAERLLGFNDKYPKLEVFGKMLDNVSDIMGELLSALGVESEPSYILGMKVASADKSVTDFDTVEEYYEYLKNDVKVDNDKLNGLSSMERIVYSVVGLSVQVGVFGEKIGVNINADSVEMLSKIVNIGKIAFGSKEIIHLIEVLKDDGITDLSDMVECIMGAGESDRVKTGRALENAFDIIRPNEGRNILNTIIDEIRSDKNEYT